MNLTKEKALQKIKELQKYIEQLDSKPTIESKIETIGKTVFGESILVDETRNNILVPLPKCNTDWTLEAFRWTERFCQEYAEAYPTHYAYNDNDEFIHINVADCGWI